MRNIILFMMLLIGFSTSCSKGDDPSPPSPPPPVAELEPSILEFTIAPTDAIIPIYSDIVIKYKGDINTKKISINGEDMPNIDGIKTYSRVASTTEYTAVATNKTKTVTKKITANVGDWKSSTYGLISHGYWHKTAYRQYVGTFLYLENIPDIESRNRKSFFYSNGTRMVYNADGTPWSDQGLWRLSEDNKMITFSNMSQTLNFSYSITKINENEFIISREIDPVNQERRWEFHYHKRTP